MKVLRNLFQSQLERLTAADNYLGCHQFEKLLRQLKTPAGHQKLIKCLSMATDNPYKIVKILAVANILLLYSKDHYQVIETHLTSKQPTDDWLKNKFIIPYYTFLIRCCMSKGRYIACRTLKIRKQDALKTLFYSINMLKMLFKVVEKMPFLGRYYKHRESDPSVSMAMQIITLQAQKLYRAFYFLLQDILRFKDVYIKSVEDQTMMRGIFIDQLSAINQEMTKLFLDKYFAPLSKGISVKLFRPEQQGLNFQMIFNSIATSRETSRQTKRSELYKTLFPKTGQVNWTFYQESLRSSSTTTQTASQSDQCNLQELNYLAFTQQSQKMKKLANNEKMYESGHCPRLNMTGAMNKKRNDI